MDVGNGQSMPEVAVLSAEVTWVIERQNTILTSAHYLPVSMSPKGVQLCTWVVPGIAYCLLLWIHHYIYNYFSTNFSCRRFPLMFIFRHPVYFLMLRLNKHYLHMIPSFSVINCQWSSRRILSLYSTIPLKVVSCKGYKNVNMDYLRSYF